MNKKLLISLIAIGVVILIVVGVVLGVVLSKKDDTDTNPGGNTDINNPGGNTGDGDNTGDGGNSGGNTDMNIQKPEAKPMDYEYYVSIKTGRAYLTKYIGNDTIITLPEKDTEGHDVYGFMADDSFKDSLVETVYIPAQYDYIDQNYDGTYSSPFTYAINLKEIVVDKDSEAFSSYKGVMYDKEGKVCISVPNQIKTLDLVNTCEVLTENALLLYYDSENWKPVMVQVENINFSNSLKYLTLSWCNNIKKVDLSNTQIENMMQNAFYHCESLEEIVLPKDLKTISHDAFSFTAITSITIPANVRAREFDLAAQYIDGTEPYIGISDSIFRGCSKLEEITAPAQLLFGEYDFQDSDFPATYSDGPINNFLDSTALRKITINGVLPSENATAWAVPDCQKTHRWGNDGEEGIERTFASLQSIEYLPGLDMTGLDKSWVGKFKGWYPNVNIIGLD